MNTTSTQQTTTPQEVYKQHQHSVITLLDVRTPIEFREVHAEMAHNIPLDQLDPELVKKQLNDSDQPIYVICRSGNRGAKACDALSKSGIANVINVEGGTLAWESAGLPVVRGKKMMSLERQVRILAGFIVFVGAILAMTVHEYFAGISAFIGAGLMFAGITDTCGMGLMLARMPWNQVKQEDSNQPVEACSINQS